MERKRVMERKPLMLFEADDNGHTNEAVAAIKKKVEGNGGFMRPISDLAHVVSVLDDVNKRVIPIDFELSSVDLIGHGSPGELSVGWSVRGVRESLDAANMPRHHVLSSDPRAYPDLHALVTMRTPLLSDGVPLRLLGCHTASSGQRSSAHERKEIDSRILLLALANMLKCKVQGTTDFISEKDFNSAFTKTSGLVGFGTTDSVPITEDADAPLNRRMPAPPLGSKKLPRVGSDAITRANWREIVIPEVARTVGPDSRPVAKDKLQAILAACEDPGWEYPTADSYLLAVEVAFELPNNDRLEILSRGRYVRWVRAAKGSTVLFSVANEIDREEKMVLAVRDAVGSLGSWIR